MVEHLAKLPSLTRLTLGLRGHKLFSTGLDVLADALPERKLHFLALDVREARNCQAEGEAAELALPWNGLVQPQTRAAYGRWAAGCGRWAEGGLPSRARRPEAKGLPRRADVARFACGDVLDTHYRLEQCTDTRH